MMPPTHERDTDVIAFYSSHHGEGKTIAALNFYDEWKVSLDRQVARISPKSSCHLRSFNAPIEKMLSELIPVLPNMSFHKGTNEELRSGCGYTMRELARQTRKGIDAVDPYLLVQKMAYSTKVYVLEAFLIDDLTFPREYDFLRERGAKIVRIKRPDCNFIPAEEDGLLDDREFDAVIVNDGTIEELRRKVWDTCSPWIELRKLTPAEV